MVRILVVDHDTIARESMARALRHEPGLMVWESATVDDSHWLIAQESIDVVLIQQHPAGYPDAANTSPPAPVAQKALIVTSAISDFERKRLVALGVGGIFSRQRDFRDLVEAIRRVGEGGHWFDDIADAKGADLHLDLTRQESRVLHLVIEGLSNKDVGARMGVSESHVKGLLQRVFLKAGVRSRGQLIRIAMKHASAIPSDRKSIALSANTGSQAAKSSETLLVSEGSATENGWEQARAASDSPTSPICPVSGVDCRLLRGEALKRCRALMDLFAAHEPDPFPEGYEPS